jgi:hypothetical protein
MTQIPAVGRCAADSEMAARAFCLEQAGHVAHRERRTIGRYKACQAGEIAVRGPMPMYVRRDDGEDDHALKAEPHHN